MLLPAGQEQSCWHPMQDCNEKNQGLVRSDSATFGCASAQDEQDQRKESKNDLHVLAVDLLSEEGEFKKFSFHESPFLYLICV